MSELTNLATMIQSIKNGLKTAIRSKGVTVSDSDPFTSYPQKVSDIEPTINTLNVTPSTQSQIINVPTGVHGFNPVNVTAVTNTIDQNITSNNIRNGITILGVTGNIIELQGQTKVITQNGIYSPDSGYNGITSLTVNVSDGGGGEYTNVINIENAMYGTNETVQSSVDQACNDIEWFLYGEDVESE